MSIIKTIELNKYYGEGRLLVKALNNINIEIEDEEFVAIIGPSGSGKSSLLNILGGLDAPTNGKVLYKEVDIYEMKDSDISNFRLHNVGFVFQAFNLIPEMTAYENIVLPRHLDGKKVQEKDIDQILSILNISERSNHYPHQLSGGEQQRVAIARAMINNPEVILCDEPTGNLDYKTSRDVMDYLIRLNKEYHKTIVMVTHDNSLAKEAKRIIYLEDGVIKEDKNKENI